VNGALTIEDTSVAVGGEIMSRLFRCGSGAIALSVFVALAANTPQAQELGKIIYKVINVRSSDTLNLRKEPDPDSSIITSIPGGATGIVSTGRTASFGTQKWFEITYAGRKGWVNARYLEKIAAEVIEMNPSALKQNLLNFETFKGRWKGVGWFTNYMGEKEKGECALIVQPDHGPWQGSMELACRTPSIDIQARGYKLKIVEGSASGLWQLTNYSIDGSLTGHVTENSFYAVLKTTEILFATYSANIHATMTDDCTASVRIAIQAPIEIRSAQGSFKRC
jgi:Bacterial SH3 domain